MLATPVPWPEPASNVGWVHGWDPSEGITNTFVEHSVFRNAVQLGGAIMRDWGPAKGGHTGGGATTSNSGFRHNLFVSTLYQGRKFEGPQFHVSDQPFDSAAVPLTGLTWDHNTFFIPEAINPVSASGTSASNVFSQFSITAWSGNAAGQIDKFTYTNNINPPSMITHGDLGADVAGGVLTLGAFTTSTAKVWNNAFPGFDPSDAWCDGRCQGNIKKAVKMDDQFVDAAHGDFHVAPSSPYRRAATDGTDLGANIDQLPLISHLSVQPTGTTAVLKFDLSSPIQDAANSQPCVLEVSPSSNLHSGLGTYAVVNDLNPTYFKQPDASNRSNPLLPAVSISNGHVEWPIGQNNPVSGDDGKSHDLRLQPSTTYYGRVMCYGDTQNFTFSTLAGGTGAQ